MYVRDNGIGIAHSDQNRIFEPFERLGQNEAPGTGIGLTIVKKIIELYEGKLWVDSEPEKGSTFYFTLSLCGELPSSRAVKTEAGA
jgi:signal transduction histidine kinase